jgi:hypothetical protein
MKKSEFNSFFERTISEILATSKSGQKEYALNEEAFDNFNRLAQDLKLDRKAVLFVYMKKHIDGIVSYINGHKSQREDVRGRIKDVIVYCMLLWAMIEEDDNPFVESKTNTPIGSTKK